MPDSAMGPFPTFRSITLSPLGVVRSWPSLAPLMVGVMAGLAAAAGVVAGGIPELFTVTPDEVDEVEVVLVSLHAARDRTASAASQGASVRMRKLLSGRTDRVERGKARNG